MKKLEVHLELVLPLTVTIPRKTKAGKKYSLNLNNYRNWYHHENNALKVLYKGIVAEAVKKAEGTLGKPPYRFMYTVFASTKRLFDLGNVCAIVQKFADDALIELGLLSDDNYTVVREIDYRFGGIDKENPRAELRITSLSAPEDIHI